MKADVIHNTTTTHFGFIDRLKLLIGGVAVTRLEITTEHEIVLVTRTIAKTHVQYPDWINRLRFRNKVGGGECLEAQSNPKLS
jgi:hypothetical protein